MARNWRQRLSHIFRSVCESSDGELAAYISYAVAFPNSFVALVDTYDMRKSGLINFCSVALSLHELGYQAIGIRIDSGDLAYLSRFAAEHFTKISEEFKIPEFRNLAIMVSNDINEETIASLRVQGQDITGYGIGTHLVTCQKQPALGCVYKMVEINGHARIKISQDLEKMTLPGRKNAYRLFGGQGDALIDLMLSAEEPDPQPNQRVLCRHPFDRSKRTYVVPQKIDSLLQLYWHNGQIIRPLPPLIEIRDRVRSSLGHLRPDVKRSLNPTPYKTAVSEHLYNAIQDLWFESAPIGELV